MRGGALVVGSVALLMLVGCQSATGAPVRAAVPRSLPPPPPPPPVVIPAPPPVPDHEEDDLLPPIDEEHVAGAPQPKAGYPTPVIHVRMHAIVASNDDGSEPATATVEAIVKAVKTTNAYYEPVGIYFDFDPRTDFEYRRDTLVNYDCIPVSRGGTSKPKCDDRANREERRRVAAAYPNKMVVLFRSFNNNLKYDAASGFWRPGKATGGFSGKDLLYVAAGPGASGGTFLAHEIGHYFHLDHPFRTGVSTVPAAAELIRRYVEEGGHPASQGLQVFDGDVSTVTDTPPDVAGSIYVSVGLTPCGKTGEVAIPVTFSNGARYTYTLAPDRHNIMSYFKNCQLPHDFSPQQIARMRDALLRGNRRIVAQIPR